METGDSDGEKGLVNHSVEQTLLADDVSKLQAQNPSRLMAYLEQAIVSN
jgi:hypothetical protein